MSAFSPALRLTRAALPSLVCALLTLGLTRIASATVYYVATTGSNFNTGLSWSSPKSNLQSTITAAHSGDQVWVEKGTYTGNFTATDGVAVYGGFAGTESSISQRNIAANPAILDGNQANTVYTIPSSATGANTLDGFTVQNGGSNDNSNSGGHGLGDSSTSDTLKIANCTFTNNNVFGSGGGVAAQNISTNITNCIFTSNSAYDAGGGIYTGSTTAIITGCTFNNNTGNGGGVYNAGEVVTISGCMFIGNTGGATTYNGTATISGCTFTNNSESGVTSLYATATAISDCTFTGNSVSSGNGGGIYVDETFGQGSTTIEDCTFGGSSTSDVNSPEAIYLQNIGDTSTTPVTPALVKDCLIIGSGTSTTDPNGVDVSVSYNSGTSYVTFVNNTIVNTNVGINAASSGGTINIANNAFEGDYGSFNATGSPAPTFTSSHNDNYNNVSYYYQGLNPSPSDLTVNPLFVNAAGGDYQLASNSPLINAGDDSYVMSGDLDLAGNPRIYGSHVDIGAYEYTPSGTPVPASITFNPASVASGAPTTATVTLTLPAPSGGAVVMLTSSNTTAAPVPASVTVPAGATSATFKITTGTVTASTNVTITAKLNGTSVTGTLTVAPQGIASVTLSSYTITGGDAITGAVNLLYPAATNTVVTLAPGGSDSVPASVTVKANTTTATFTVLTSAVPAKIGASVLATLNGKSVKGGFTLLPPQVATLVLAPNAVMGGTPTMANISLNVPAPSGGIVVTLTSSNTAAASVPSSVTVPAGAISYTFPVTTYAVTGYTKVTISSETTALVGAAPLTLLP